MVKHCFFRLMLLITFYELENQQHQLLLKIHLQSSCISNEKNLIIESWLCFPSQNDILPAFNLVETAFTLPSNPKASILFRLFSFQFTFFKIRKR